jgi:hypothetical protein
MTWWERGEEAARPIANGGFTMVPNGPTKRKRGGIWTQLGVSACVILLPPLVIAAGVVVFDSTLRQGAEPEDAAQEAVEPQATLTKSASWAERPEAATSYGLASAAQHPVITEQHPVAEERQAAEQPATTAEASESPVVAKDESKPYYGPIPVTLIHVRKPDEPAEQTAMADDEAPPPPPTVTPADEPVAVPKQSAAATRIHVAHVSRKIERHEPRGAHKAKQERARPLNESKRVASVAGKAAASAGKTAAGAGKAAAGAAAHGAPHSPNRKVHQASRK